MIKNHFFTIIIVMLFTTLPSFSQTFSGTTGPITDNNCATTPNTFSTTVSGVGVIDGSSQKLAYINVDMTHPYIGDISLTLENVNTGTTVTLVSPDGSDAGDNYTGTVFTMGSNTSITLGIAPYNAGFLPEGDLNSFTGENANGAWNLIVCDNFDVDTGTLYSWSITFAPFFSASDNFIDGLIGIPTGEQFSDYPSIANNTGATASEFFDPVGIPTGCGTVDNGGYFGSDIWYAANVSNNGTLTIETAAANGSSITDTAIEIFDFSYLSIACNDDKSGTDYFSKIELAGLIPGEDILIRLWSFNNNTFGEFQISAYANNTYVPDDNFENYLETHNASGTTVPIGDPTSMGNGLANDDLVPTSRINTVTNLNLSGVGISDLTGIEDFTTLTVLGCDNNNLATIDISNNINLTYLSLRSNSLTAINIDSNINLEQFDISANNVTNLNLNNNLELKNLWLLYNNLGTLDVTNNIALETLDIQGINISELDVSNNVSLSYLDCGGNILEVLDLTNNVLLNNLSCKNNQLNYLNVANGNNTNLLNFRSDGNPNLSCIKVDDAAYSTTNWTLIDPTSSFSEDCDLTYVPDDKFEDYLETHDASGAVVPLADPTSMGNGIANDNLVETSRINTVTNLDISSLNSMDNLIGIEDFIALTSLHSFENDIRSIDLSANTALTTLIFTHNSISDLDLSANTSLTILECQYNSLTSLDLSSNTGLTTLICNDNLLTSINVTGNTVLTDLICNHNNLISLDLSTNTGLTYLDCFVNNLTSLNLSANTGLSYLSCGLNNLNSLDLPTNTGLTFLSCGFNNLSSIDVSANTGLISFYCNTNNLSNLNLSNNTALTSLNCGENDLTYLNVANGNNANMITFYSLNNPNLACIEVDDAAYSTTNWTLIDPTSSFSEDCGLTYVPDNNFESYLETHDANHDDVPLGSANSMGNGIANDNLVFTNRINTVTSLNINELSGALNIVDLTGIEDFTALTNLDCLGQSLTSLDLSANTALTNLNCNENYLTSLNLSGNTQLAYLVCSFNNLTSLDVSANTSLIELVCSLNSLTSLDVSANTALINLSCNNNQLIYLDVANGNNSNVTFYNSQNNPNLSCIKVDNTAYSTTNWSTFIDPASSFSEDCGITIVPDDNFESYLETHDASGTVVPLADLTSMGNGIANDNFVFTDRINTVTDLNVNSLNIADLTGIEDFTALESLICYLNQLTSINVSQNTALDYLNCGDNSINSLDVSQNTALTYLRCNDNGLTELDVTNNTLLTTLRVEFNAITELNTSQNTALTFLRIDNNELIGLGVSQNTALINFNCSNNQLVYLDVANGNNANVTFYNSQNNPNLSCIKVDNAAYSTTNWSAFVDPASSFSEDCGITIVPDDNFENYLETHDEDDNVVILGAANSMGNGIANDNLVETSRINTVLILNLNTESISDLTGIEGFGALTDLIIANNQIETIDLSQNSALEYLYCARNLLGDLDLSQNTALIHLICSSNNLTTLNLSQNTALEHLTCGGINLESIDLSHNIALLDLYIDNNNLTTLNLSQNTALEYIYCPDNNLTTIDLSQNIALKSLVCPNNNLTDVDLSNNIAITNIELYNNQLQSLNMANGNNANIQELFVENNPDLTCVTLDNATIAYDWNFVIDTSSFLVKDPQTQFSANCGEVVFRPFAYLQGALPSDIPRITDHRGGPSVLMRDDLRNLGLIPLNSPYDGVPLPNPNILNTGGVSGTGNLGQDIVDWVLVELRDDVDPAIIVDEQSALISRDGTIVNLDGSLDLVFIQPAKYYNVVVKHRNHSAIMSDTKQAFPRDFYQVFRAGPDYTLGTNAQFEFETGSFAMWAGDVNNNGEIKFSGAENDVNELKDFIISHPTNPFGFITATINGYFDQDVDMKGQVKFSGSDNDSNIIKDIILNHPGNFLQVPTFTISTQVPEN